MIPYGKQSINQQDQTVVLETLQSAFLTQGPQVPLFESHLCRYTGAQAAVVMNSGTAALHLAYLALGVGNGDSVWTTPISFVATANAALYCGAEVDFVDVDVDTGLMSVEALAQKLTEAKAVGKLPKVVSPVHFAGQVAAMADIKQLADQYGFKIVEDAAHALGASYQSQKVGACEYSDVTIFSFHPVKIITTGEGGAALTNQPELAEKMRQLRSHGTVKTDEMMQQQGRWYYEQVDLGFNYRMTDMQAALGNSQLERLDDFLARRRELVQAYNQALPEQVRPLAVISEQSSAWHLYVIQVANRRAVYDKLHQLGIAVQVHYIPIHWQPYYQKLGFKCGDFPNSEAFYEQVLSLPLYVDLTDDEQQQVVSAVKQAVSS